jgi:integrase/recombinase XerD
VLDYHTIDLLAQAASVGRCAARDRALVWMLYGTGARVSELLSADVGDLDGDRLKVQGLKGSGERYCEIPPLAGQALHDYLVTRRPHQWIRGEPLFVNMQGNRLTRKSAWWVLQRARQALGCRQRVFPHAMRHSCATHLIEGGAATREVQEYLGHRRITSTQIYTHVARGRLAELAQSVHPAGRRNS